ncbi:MAG: winged helix-turn-helix domain-containing protein [Solirubrobacterales bacterium]
MKIGKVRKQTPQGPPAQGGATAGTSPEEPAAGGLERRVWEELAPLLLHPTKLAFIQLLLEAGKPLTAGELAKAVGIARGHAEHHCIKMEAAGVLEAVISIPRAENQGKEPSYFFLKAAGPLSASAPNTGEE